MKRILPLLLALLMALSLAPGAQALLPKATAAPGAAPSGVAEILWEEILDLVYLNWDASYEDAIQEILALGYEEDFVLENSAFYVKTVNDVPLELYMMRQGEGESLHMASLDFPKDHITPADASAFLIATLGPAGSLDDTEEGQLWWNLGAGLGLNFDEPEQSIYLMRLGETGLSLLLGDPIPVPAKVASEYSTGGGESVEVTPILGEVGDILTPEPTGEATGDLLSLSIPAGQYKVGSDLSPGEYVLLSNSDAAGYFCVTSDANGRDIVFNDNFDTNSIITVQDGEYLQLSRCVAIPSIDFYRTHRLRKDKLGIMLKVGLDIDPGEYKLESTDDEYGAYYCVYENSRHDPIVTNDIFENTTYVEVFDGQYLLLNRCLILQ